MSPTMLTNQSVEWVAYYTQFPYFSSSVIRAGCEPRCMIQPGGSTKAIVLVHGLTDSPYFMRAIANYFFTQLGYNVYLPLLHCHGLKDPQGMEGVKLEEWKANVRYAVDMAAAAAQTVSIGGLSTGGALSFYMATQTAKLNGALYLFSAALDLAGGSWGVGGQLQEQLLRTFLVDLLDSNCKTLIGPNPYRYARMDLDGARELALLLRETDELLTHYTPHQPFPKPVFAAHSASDTTATMAGIEALQRVSRPERFTFFRIPKAAGVTHASVVLATPIYAPNTAPPAAPLEKANPQFPAMMAAIKAFATHLP